MSDEDFFQSSQKDIREPNAVRDSGGSKTQPQKSDVEYHWNVVFHWDIGNRTPFAIYPRAVFSDSEVPASWYAFKLRDDLRKKKIYIRMLNGNFSIFCKVEKGMPLIYKIRPSLS